MLADKEISDLLESIDGFDEKKPSKTEESLVKPLTVPTYSSHLSDSADDQQLMRDILNQVKELTDEVRMFRQRFDTEQTVSADEVSDVIRSKSESKSAAQYVDSSPTSLKKKSKVLTVVSNLLFYLVMIMIVFGAFLIKSNKGGKPWSFAGYSAMTVLTGSMQDIYPQGSLIIIKSVDADKLSIGDDITFMTGETSSITHRIIGITENYLETGERGFETKGVMNTNADKDIVAASNIVGRVVFCSLALGKMAKFATTNWQLLLFYVLVLVALIVFLQWNARRSEKDDQRLKNNFQSRHHTRSKK